MKQRQQKLGQRKRNKLLIFSPKNLQNRAKSIMYAIRGQVDVGEENRIIYLPSEETGSSIADLLQFYTLPATSAGIQMRPADAFRFGQVLKHASVQTSSFGKGKSDLVDRLEQNQDVGRWQYLY